ncbi:Beta-TrCP [Smittium culicis]|uniref:Beta-TrCP n=1 Tax=Smittium culicis TaxID=133412 RepID=A0A1R1YHA2_9FUNG|nr:Beta-TrCP [Smittium culicis]
MIILNLDIKTVLICREVSNEWKDFIDSNVVWKRLFLKVKEWKTEKIKRFLNKDTSPYSSSQELIFNKYYLGFNCNKSPFSKYLLDKGHSTKNKSLIDSHKGGFLSLNSHNYSDSSANQLLNNEIDIAMAKSRTVHQEENSFQRHDSASYYYIEPGKALFNQEISKPIFSSNCLKSKTASINTSNTGISKPQNFVYALSLNWSLVYKDFYELEKNWKDANASLRIINGHNDSIYCIQLDKYKFVTGSRDKSIKIWDMNSLVCIRTLYGHTASVLCLKYDDEIIVTGSSDSTIIVWDMNTGSIISKLESHIAGVLDVAFNSEFIVSCSKDCTIKIWSRKNNYSLVSTLSGHEGPVNAISLYNNELVSASGDTLIKLWDLKTGKEIRVFKGHLRGLACVQYDGNTIISGSNDRSIKVWDSKTGICKFTLLGHTDLVRTLYFPGGKKAISGSYDQTVKVWDIENGVLLLDIDSVHTSWVFDVQFNSSKIIR